MSIAALITVHDERGDPVHLNPSRILAVEKFGNLAHAECHSRILMNIPNLSYIVREHAHEIVELVAGVVKAKG